MRTKAIEHINCHFHFIVWPHRPKISHCRSALYSLRWCVEYTGRLMHKKWTIICFWSVISWLLMPTSIRTVQCPLNLNETEAVQHALCRHLNILLLMIACTMEINMYAKTKWWYDYSAVSCIKWSLSLVFIGSIACTFETIHWPKICQCTLWKNAI